MPEAWTPEAIYKPELVEWVAAEAGRLAVVTSDTLSYYTGHYRQNFAMGKNMSKCIEAASYKEALKPYFYFDPQTGDYVGVVANLVPGLASGLRQALATGPKHELNIPDFGPKYIRILENYGEAMIIAAFN